MSYVGNKPAQTTIPVDDSVTTAMIQDDAVTTDKVANAINTSIAANTSKVTNATHTGDVTGATALTIAAGAVDVAMLSATGSASSSTVLYGDGTWKAEPVTDTGGLEDDIALLGFKVASNGSLAKYNLVDQTIDDFQDTSGVNAGASTNEIRDSSGKYYSGTESANYWGDGSDGSLTTSGDVTHTVQNKNGSYDGDMVVKQYTALTISTGDTMKVDQACRGMLIYVAGDCTINGTLSMDLNGAYADPTASGGSDSNAVQAAGLQWPMVSDSGSATLTAAATLLNGCGTEARTAVALHDSISGNGTIFSAVRQGENGGAGGTTNPGADGDDGTGNNKTGGGGAGARADAGTSGSGAYGSCFTGGSGGGGIYLGTGGGSGTNWGGPGGNGRTDGHARTSGGAGHPGGTGGTAANPGQDGTGGLLVLFVRGNLTIGGSGSITAIGGHGGNKSGATYCEAYGGGSGGGLILCGYGGTLSNSGSITVAGGAGGTGDSGGSGGAGGDGDTQVVSVVGQSFNNMTLVSNTTAAQAAPTKGDVVLTYTNGAGSTTLDTDLTAEISADGGSTWTALALTSEGSTGSHNIASSHDVTISSTITAPYNMAYRVKTLNQSVSKTTRIQAVSLGWS